MDDQGGLHPDCWVRDGGQGVSPLDRACDLTPRTVGGRLTSQTGRMGATIKQSDYFFKESVDWVKGGLFFLFVVFFFLALLFHVVKLRRGRKWSWERHTAAVTSSLSLILASVF